MSNVFQAKRTISFKKGPQSSIIVSVSQEEVKVQVTLQVESEDYASAQDVMDILTTVMADTQEHFTKKGEPNA